MGVQQHGDHHDVPSEHRVHKYVVTSHLAADVMDLSNTFQAWKLVAV